MVLKGPNNTKNMGLNFFKVIKAPIWAPESGYPLKSGNNLNFLISGQIFMCGTLICS